MSDQVWIAIATILGALFTAVASSGVVGAIQNRGKNTVERKKIEEDIITQVRYESDKRNSRLEARLELQEYKFDMLLEEHLAFIDRVKAQCSSSTDVELLSQMRVSAMKLKYLDKIPGAENDSNA